MNGKKSKLVIALVATVLLLLAVFLAGRYGWKLGGFRACGSAGITAVEVTESGVRLKGFYPGSFPEGFCGYYAQEKEGTLYVGFRFSAVFGFFETGDFDITIPVTGEIREVVLKTRGAEYPIWNAGSGEAPDESPGPAASPGETSAAREAYAAVLGEYAALLQEGWDASHVMEAGLDYLVTDSFFDAPLEDIGYAVVDLDGDGTEELAIGSGVEDAFLGKLIFALYTLDEDGTPLLLFESTERNRYYYAGGCRFANLGSSAWNESYVTTLKLEDREMIDMTYTTDSGDYVQMELTPFSRWGK